MFRFFAISFVEIYGFAATIAQIESSLIVIQNETSNRCQNYRVWSLLIIFHMSNQHNGFFKRVTNAFYDIDNFCFLEIRT